MTENAETLRNAIAAHQAGRYAEAESGYLRVLSAAPAQPKALYFYGLLHFHRGNLESALDHVERAVKISPSNAQAWNTLGGLYIAAQRPKDAKHAYRQAISVAPMAAEGWYNFGICARDEGDVTGAIDALREAVTREPSFKRGYGALANLLYQTGRIADAAVFYRRWAEREPSNAYARHMAAASSGENVPERAPDDFVREHFDAFAEKFDASVGRLGYRAPGLVAAALSRVSGSVASLLDAGCGTGLCGPLVRGLTQQLIGVDLSERMLARAAERRVYDELIASELTAFMRSRLNVFDAAISADTLCYFGTLEIPLRAVREALRERGVLVFTVEALEASGDTKHVADHRLEPHGRYTHSEPYTRRALAVCGFEVLELARDRVRQEAGRDVAGWVVAARRA